MIAYLKGIVLKKQEKSIILDTGNIGYEVFVTPSLLEVTEKETELELFAYTHVREDALDIFGFEKEEELGLFKKFISISGVGPKTAQDILSLPIDKLKNAILNEESAFICQVPKIGKKIADRIILELKNKISIDDADRMHGNLSSDKNENAIFALEKLGYNRKQITQGLTNLPADVTSSEEMIKYFLQNA
ncbi:Holliday junction branch migration protein RuvA [Candidatus Peregrinibacteria bacterium]|jgi:holliday junction DNA helicase RuvA|nr:Holliday junction branch migration protein RuvA [Candidatus Peregrinibacteria bacterium]MBT4148184.1 Holliday junction branch migration protein RuvA [Candidatus Peregrinibacteria bacterium]MBT4365895.1 Holliday junction branch migration protein RuvA [Candidatus Peregrinibacteria bacterium]MBT4455658.1 Holliday junction branch migration protein RuvA [Candidatus Peregrinibacteria bacterium]